MQNKDILKNVPTDILQQILDESCSRKEILIKLQCNSSSWALRDLKNRIQRDNLSEEKYFFNRDNKINTSRKVAAKQKEIPLEDVFKENGHIASGTMLKKKILKFNLKLYCCSICKNPGMHFGKPLTLQLDHIDGNKLNNNLNNLQILCPNCHSLTPNWAGKNLKFCRDKNKNITDEVIIAAIPKCQSISEVLRFVGLTDTQPSRNRVKSIIKQYNLKLNRRSQTDKGIDAALKNRKVERPSPEELKKLVWEKPTTEVAKELGVSDKSIEKWCKFYNVPKPPVGFWIKKKYNTL